MLYDVDFNTGKVRWETGAPKGNPDGSEAREEHIRVRDARDGRRFVYVYFGGLGLYAVDFTGKVAWSKEMSLPPIPSTDVSAGTKPPRRSQAALPRDAHGSRVGIVADAVPRTGFSSRSITNQAVAGRRVTARRMATRSGECTAEEAAGLRLVHAVRLAERPADRADYIRRPVRAVL